MHIDGVFCVSTEQGSQPHMTPLMTAWHMTRVMTTHDTAHDSTTHITGHMTTHDAAHDGTTHNMDRVSKEHGSRPHKAYTPAHRSPPHRKKHGRLLTDPGSTATVINMAADRSSDH